MLNFRVPKFLNLKIVFIGFGFICSSYSLAQSLPSGYPSLEEYFRRGQLRGDTLDISSWMLRPNVKFDTTPDPAHIHFMFVPFRISTILNTGRPYWNSPQGMIPAKGAQVYASGGISISHKYFEITLQPEINIAQNSTYMGFQGFDEEELNRLYFRNLRRGDQPELFGKGAYSRVGVGQSKIVGKLGAFEAGISTQNIWWGPGQWNALTFSNNAPGFPHGMIKTQRPAKTFFGSFEFELLSGMLKSNKFNPTQKEELNASFYRPLRNKSRYLNALMFSIQPKWIKGFYFGASRTVQTFSDSVSTSNFVDVLPVFWGVTKQSVGSDLIGRSDRGRDQQITAFFRYVFPQAGFEFYGEFGRRDHALNLRDLTLSPAHARSYLLGFNKLFKLTGHKMIQIRSEVTQQQQSINRVVRANSTTPWHTNATIGGFSNMDQALGVGIGMGSNIQVLEVSLVEKFDKLGVYFERLGNNQDFYDEGEMTELGYKPWIDFTFGALFDKQFDRILISTKTNLTYTNNYQWSGKSPTITDFAATNTKFSFHSNWSLIYFFR